MGPGDPPEEPACKRLKWTSSKQGLEDCREVATHNEEKTKFVHKKHSWEIPKRKNCTFVQKGSLFNSKPI